MRILNVGTKFFNAYLLALPDGYCLIDCGAKKDYRHFRDNLLELRIRLDEIKYVIITHAHADHVGFLKQLIDDASPTVIFNPKQAMRLEAGKNNMNVFVSTFFGLLGSRYTTTFVDKYQCFPSVKTDTFVPYTAHPLAEYGFSFIPLSGHTDADLAIKVGSDLFCGDICMNVFPATKHCPVWLENKFELMKSWETILSDHEIATIYPAHGKAFDLKELSKDLAYWRDKGVFKLFKTKKNIY